MSDKLVRIKNRYDTAVNWYTENPILAAGEIGIDSTNNHLRIGDGKTVFNLLPLLNNNTIDTGIFTIQKDLGIRPTDTKLLHYNSSREFFIDTYMVTEGVGNIEYHYGPRVTTYNMYKSVDIYVEGYGEITIKFTLDNNVTDDIPMLTTSSPDYVITYKYSNVDNVYNVYLLHSLTDANNEDCIYIITQSYTSSNAYSSTYFYLSTIKPTENNVYDVVRNCDDGLFGKKVRNRLNLR